MSGRTVRPECLADFESRYGGNGEWVRLFRRHPGYILTELLRDATNRNRYWTLDRWRSRADHEEFRTRFAKEFAEIDRACESLTRQETHLGDLEEVTDEA
jgi:heme-degrading monooxygenase HmoA